MLLTILIPSFNQGRYIAQTLDSCLMQGYRPLEIVVVDGGSTDDSVPIIRAYSERHPEVRWVSEPDRGPADAVNKGLAMAHGSICAIQSSDDIYRPDAFSAAMDHFRAHPDCGLLIGDCEGLDEGGNVLYRARIPEFSYSTYFAWSMTIPQSSIFFRTRLGVEIGGWNEQRYSPDIEFWTRLALRTRAVHIPRILSGWRIYRGQRTHAKEARKRIWEDYWRMINEIPELAKAPPRLRQLARAGGHLLALRFHPTGDRRTVQRHLLRGALLHPMFWLHYPWPIVSWLPGMRWWGRWRA